jgi:hypothetical protein
VACMVGASRKNSDRPRLSGCSVCASPLLQHWQAKPNLVGIVSCDSGCLERALFSGLEFVQNGVGNVILTNAVYENSSIKYRIVFPGTVTRVC